MYWNNWIKHTKHLILRPRRASMFVKCYSFSILRYKREAENWRLHPGDTGRKTHFQSNVEEDLKARAWGLTAGFQTIGWRCFKSTADWWDWWKKGTCTLLIFHASCFSLLLETSENLLESSLPYRNTYSYFCHHSLKRGEMTRMETSKQKWLEISVLNYLKIFQSKHHAYIVFSRSILLSV